MVINSPCLTDKKELTNLEGTALGVILKSVDGLQFAQNCMVFNSPYLIVKSWLAHKVMACGKGSGKP